MSNESNRESAMEHLGITEDEFDQLVHDCIEAYNSVPGSSVVQSVHAAIPVVRHKMLGEDGAGISMYEKALAGVMFSMGKGLVASKVKRILDAASRLMEKKAPLPAVYKHVMESLLAIVGMEFDDGDE
jgi:hypothetical protein